MIIKQFDQKNAVYCDAKCDKARGINSREEEIRRTECTGSNR